MPLLGMVMDDPTRMATIVKGTQVPLPERMVPIDAVIPVLNKGPSFGDCSLTNKVHSETIKGILDPLDSDLEVDAIPVETTVDISVTIGTPMGTLLDTVDLGTVPEMPSKLLGNGATQTVAKDGEPMPFEKHEVALLFKVDCSVVPDVPLQNQPILEDILVVVRDEPEVEVVRMLDIYLAA